MIKKNLIKRTALIMITALVLTGCSAGDITESITGKATATEQVSADIPASEGQESVTNESEDNLSSAAATASASTLLDTTQMFSDRDLEQEADLTEATKLELKSGEDLSITSEGVYVISGTASDCTIIVEAADTDKVQLVLDGARITNSDSPAIYVKSADKVFVTTTEGSSNSLEVTGAFTADGEVNTDAVIFSREDLVLNGKGTLTVTSSDNGISCKDDLKVTGGTYNITSKSDAIEANDSIRVYDGSFNIDTDKDALHAENEDDNTLGYIYIAGGDFKIQSDSDGIQATTVLMIDGGTFDITGSEGLEATYVQINDGTISISASDDGINATQKSTSYDVVIEVNGGDITVTMGQGDTDGFDANGYIYINGGNINVTCNSPFDFDKGAELNGGTVIANGEEITEITASMMGPGGGGFGGGRQGGFQGQNGEFSGQGGFGGRGRGGFGGENGQMPEGMDGQMPEGFDGQVPPDFNGQQPGSDDTQTTSGTNG